MVDLEIRSGEGGVGAPTRFPRGRVWGHLFPGLLPPLASLPLLLSLPFLPFSLLPSQTEHRHSTHKGVCILQATFYDSGQNHS